MSSFQISVTPQRRTAARFVDSVRRRLQKAYADTPDVNQSDIAAALGVHRSVINRQLRGYQDMTLGRVAELGWCLGYEPVFDLVKSEAAGNAPALAIKSGMSSTQSEVRWPKLLETTP